jgi:hypothetical protein
MVIEIDSVATRFNTTIGWQTKWIWLLPSNLVAIVEWRLKNGEFDKPPFCLFYSRTRMGNFKKIDWHRTIAISQMAIEIVSVARKGHATRF